MNRRFSAFPLLALLALSPLPAWADDSGAPLLPYGPLPAPPEPEQPVITDRTVQLLLNALDREQDVARRTRLVADLGKCNKPASLDRLVKLLDDESPLVRAAAVRSLVELNAADRWPAIERKGTDESAAVRLEVVRAAQRFGTGSVILVKAIGDEDASVRSVAVSISIDAGTDAALTTALGTLPPPQQALAARALGQRKAASAAPALVELLDSPTVLVRVAALEALAQLNAVDRSLIEAQLTHTHPAVRTAAMRAAAALPDATERLALGLRGLADKDPAVRVPAAEVLGPLGQAQAIAPLFEQLGQGYEPLRLAARQALLALANASADQKPAVIAAAVPLLTHADAGRREDGSFILGELRSGEAFDQHLKLLQDADWLVVAQAAKSLGLIANPAAGDALVAALPRAIRMTGLADNNTPEKRVQTNAQFSAGESIVLSAARLKHRPILEATRQLCLNKQGPSPARAAAVWTLGALTTGDEGASTLRTLMGRMNDSDESSDVILEAVKAVGNARATSLKSQLEKLMKEQPTIYGATAHAALDRINGTRTEYTLPTVRVSADTSIEDLSESED